jgi:hypothetical protein
MHTFLRIPQIESFENMYKNYFHLLHSDLFRKTNHHTIHSHSSLFYSYNLFYSLVSLLYIISSWMILRTRRGGGVEKKYCMRRHMSQCNDDCYYHRNLYVQ